MPEETNTPTTAITPTSPQGTLTITTEMTADQILGYLGTAATTIASLGLASPTGLAVVGGAKLAAALMSVAHAALQAHIKIAGEPIDLNKLDWE